MVTGILESQVVLCARQSAGCCQQKGVDDGNQKVGAFLLGQKPLEMMEQDLIEDRPLRMPRTIDSCQGRRDIAGNRPMSGSVGISLAFLQASPSSP